MSKKTATVKWTNPDTGYGFIVDEFGQEHFVDNFPFITQEGAVVEVGDDGLPIGDSELIPSPGADKPARRRSLFG